VEEGGESSRQGAIEGRRWGRRKRAAKGRGGEQSARFILREEIS